MSQIFERLSKDKKQVGHCSNAVPNTVKNCQSRVYSERIINNTSKDSLGSTNWKSDWAKFKNKSYASVVKQNISKKLDDENKSVKIHNISHFSEKYSQNYKAQWSNVSNDRASVARSLKPLPKINYVKNQSQKVSEVDVIPTHNRFQVLNNTDFNTNCASQCNDNTVCDTLTAKIAKSKQNDGSFVKGKLVLNMLKNQAIMLSNSVS